MPDKTQVINVTGPLMVFGGPYSNLEATRAVLDEARRLKIPRDHVVCTGDLIAYGGSPVETIELVRKSKIHVVMGNCDEQLAVGAGDCGCGFPQGSTCERLSSAWFAHADAQTGASARRWLGGLPRRIDLDIGGIRLAVVHGSVSAINTFVYATSPTDLKRRELDLAGCVGVVGGHCGLPFTEAIDGRLWHNPGVIGMPANDGTPRVWFSLISAHGGGLKIEHRALDYDHTAADQAMQDAGLPPDYRIALSSGIWPSCDVLPAREKALQGVPLEAGTVEWSPAQKTDPKTKNRLSKGATALLWPDHFDHEPMAVGSISAVPPATACCPAPPVLVQATSCCAPPSNAAATHDLYRAAALTPDSTLCCITNTTWKLPELVIPPQMIAMNYGCGSTVHPSDLAGSPSILYVGVGGGLEVLQFAYFARRRGAVIGLDVVDEMLATCRRNLEDAEERNAWFKQSFIDLRKGDATNLPIADASIDVAAQNCLFNIFHADDLQRALREMGRVLKPGGRLILSDPICDAEIPAALRTDERLRAMCLTGAVSLDEYVRRLGSSGFGRIEVRARRPYRVLGPGQFTTNRPIVLESVEICAIKCAVPASGADVFAGQMAIYFGGDPAFSDAVGLTLPSNQPLPISMAEASRLRSLGRSDLHVSEPSWFHQSGGGCC